MWLDLLPLDVCERIAVHVSCGRQDFEALYLGESSPRQRTAVLSALSFKFEDSPEKGPANLALNARWARLFSSDVRAIKFSPGAVPITFQDRSHSLALFNAPALREACIWDDPIILLALAQSRSIRNLEIHLTSYSPPQLVFQVLAVLCLEKLTIHCWDDTPGILCVSQDPRYCRLLSRMCPGLTSIEVSCDCCPESDPLETILPNMPSLREVKLRFAKQATIPHLRRLQSVKVFDLIDYHQALETAMLIGDPVTEITSCARLNEDEIHGLSRFPRLSVLRCTMGEDAEYALVDTACALASLRVLDLSWRTPLENSRKEYDAIAADVEPDALLDTVKVLPNLVELHLTYVYITMSELVAILECIGPRLQTFGTDIWDQEEIPIERLHGILYSASKNNPSLRALKVVPHGLEFLWYGLEGSQVERQVLRALAAMDRLQQNAPFMEPSPIDVILENMLEVKRSSQALTVAVHH